ILTISNLFTIFANWLKVKSGWQLIHQLGQRLLAGYLSRPYSFFLDTPSSETSSYILSEVGSFANGVVLPMVEIVGRVSVSLILFGLLLWVDIQIALVMFSTLGASYLIIYLLQRKMLSRLGELRISSNIARYRALREVFDGIKTVMAYNRQGFFYRHFSEASQKFTNLQPKYQIMTTSPKYLLEILAFSTIIGITVFLYLGKGDFRLIVPKLSLYAVAGYRLLPALQKAFKSLGSFRHNLPIVDRLYEAVNNLESVQEFSSQEAISPLSFQQKIELKAISFKYANAETPTLNDLSLSIKKGEKVALVGSTGSGKTSLVDVMIGLLLPSSGQILVDDVTLSPTNVASWRENIAYVPQDVFLFDDSILNNILMGDPTGQRSAGAESVERAMKLADIFEFVQGLPEGVHTKIGEKGVRLSGGQRQRLGLARALYTKPSLLILDEATSALDNVTERGIIDALNNLPQEITTIVIAHRLTTVQHADRIYFLDQGEISAQGTYQELIHANAAFKEMAQLA
ncbi:MAG: ABC transporter ATP-binding protein, partial [Bacteroidota bacterium]